MSGNGEIRLYLDFDGVLHPFQVYPGQEEAERLGLTRKCRDGNRIFWHPLFFRDVPWLAAALEAFPDVRIYVHSSWRQMWQEDRPDDIADYLGPLAPRYVRNIPHGITGKRYDVIAYDMYRDGFKGPWVAVDDHDDGFTEAGASKHFVHTDPKRALSCPMKRDMLLAKLKLAASAHQKSRAEVG